MLTAEILENLPLSSEKKAKWSQSSRLCNRLQARPDSWTLFLSSQTILPFRCSKKDLLCRADPSSQSLCLRNLDIFLLFPGFVRLWLDLASKSISNQHLVLQPHCRDDSYGLLMASGTRVWPLFWKEWALCGYLVVRWWIFVCSHLNLIQTRVPRISINPLSCDLVAPSYLKERNLIMHRWNELQQADIQTETNKTLSTRLEKNHINYTVSCIYLAQSWTIPRLKHVLSMSGAMPLRLRMCPGCWGGWGTQHAEIHPEWGCRNAEEQSLQHTKTTKFSKAHFAS